MTRHVTTNAVGKPGASHQGSPGSQTNTSSSSTGSPSGGQPTDNNDSNEVPGVHSVDTGPLQDDLTTGSPGGSQRPGSRTGSPSASTKSESTIPTHGLLTQPLLVPNMGSDSSKRSNSPVTSSSPAVSAPQLNTSPRQQQRRALGDKTGERLTGSSKVAVVLPTVFDNTIPVEGSGPQGDVPPGSRSSSSTVGGTGRDSSTTPVYDDVVGEEGIPIDIENPQFPLLELEKLEEMVGRARWVVPVLDDGELQKLLKASIKLCKLGADVHSEACQRFFGGGLLDSFNKILNDDAVSGWKLDIQICIYNNCKLLIDLCVLKLPHDWFPLLELLSMVLNPHAKFHTFNKDRAPESLVENEKEEKPPFARPPEGRHSKGWLVDLVNRFGSQDGFKALHDRFSSGPPPPLSIMAALIKPFGLCHEVLTVSTVERFFLPLIKSIPAFMKGLSDEELRKESKADSKTEGKNDILSGTVKALKSLAARVPNTLKEGKELEMLGLEMILRLLKISSFNGKMNALNEVHKILSQLSQVSFHQRSGSWEDADCEYLTVDKMAAWIQENNVLGVVLRDNLHQPQYVEKLEKIIRFMIKEQALTLRDLDSLWEAQVGKHQAIVKNIHELLTKLAWDFSAEQLDRLFTCFLGSWKGAGKKQQEKLLELIRRLAEDDKEGVMATKVLELLWTLTLAEDCPEDIMEQALAAHLKILDYSCSQDRDQLKMEWINRFVAELKSSEEGWIIPALRQIREVCMLFNEPPPNYHPQRSTQQTFRTNVINALQNEHKIVPVVSERLTHYMEKARAYRSEHPNVPPENVRLDRRFTHIQRVSEPLRFLRFLLRDGQLWLCSGQARDLWQCLAVNAVYPTDREACFRWFTKLMSEDPDLDPVIVKKFFEENVLLLDPSFLTDNGMSCFERFFKYVNTKENKLSPARKGLAAVAGMSGGGMVSASSSGSSGGAPGAGGPVVMEDMDLIGLNYLWKVVISASSNSVAEKATLLLKDIYTNLGPSLLPNQVDIHNEFTSDCFERLKASYDTINILKKDESEGSKESSEQEAVRMMRVLTVLKEYISELDDEYREERAILPLSRACRGQYVGILVRFSRPDNDLELVAHSNDTFGYIRRLIVQNMVTVTGNASLRVELSINGGEVLEPSEDRRFISQICAADKLVMSAKMSHHNAHDSSSDDELSGEGGTSYGVGSGPSLERENKLPGVLLSNNLDHIPFLFRIADTGSELGLVKLLHTTQALLNLLPSHVQTKRRIEESCKERSANSSILPLEKLIFGQTSAETSPSKALYFFKVIYACLQPAREHQKEYVIRFQKAFMEADGMKLILRVLSEDGLLAKADNDTKRSTYVYALLCAKFLFTVVAKACVSSVIADQRKNVSVTQERYQRAANLEKVLLSIPHPLTEDTLRAAAFSLSDHMGRKAIGTLPNVSTIRSLQELMWQSSSDASDQELNVSESQEGESEYENGGESDSVLLVREALEVLALSLVLCPKAMDALTSEKRWQQFIVRLVLSCRHRSIRIASADQFFIIFTQCSQAHRPTIFLINLLFSTLIKEVPQYPEQSHEFFNLLCRLLNYVLNCRYEPATLSNAEALLVMELDLLKNIRDAVVEHGDMHLAEALLEGHLLVTKELVLFLPNDKKHFYGSAENGRKVIKELMEDFIFAASKGRLAFSHGRPTSPSPPLDTSLTVNTGGDQLPGSGRTTPVPFEHTTPVCSSPESLKAAYELLCAFCTGCHPNLAVVAETLNKLYYAESSPLVEWEYQPPVGSRPPNGFVGLKNGGATCYMNSVLQQLFMIPLVLEGVLDAVVDPDNDDLLSPAAPQDRPSAITNNLKVADGEDTTGDAETNPINAIVVPTDSKQYHLTILRQVQIIFAHLACSKLQYYVPKGFWKHYRYQGEPVNLREQHDSLEFYNTVVDSLDEAFKTLGLPPHVVQVLGGSYADQKICKDCPHRYCSQQPFTAISAEIRNHQSLKESLEQFVKGDLLEGANAYRCDKCDKKVDTVKRMVILKLPRILAIQLKRFDYDWERDCAIKFNDHFEFPRELDMAPYTVHGLGKIEGEIITGDDESAKLYENQSTRYRLVGIVVHSGQASSGHYYSYALQRPDPKSRTGGQGGQAAPAQPQWFKFDDGEVSECKMEDDEELKNQCFGGEYMGEVFDHMLKRVSFRRQKRWWNAYLLFYEKIEDEEEEEEDGKEGENASSEQESKKESKKVVSNVASSLGAMAVSTSKRSAVCIPPSIERAVRRQNVEFSHNKSQFSHEYFNFMKLLIRSNIQSVHPGHPGAPRHPDAESLAMTSVLVATRFLFSVGFHTKKSLRGSAQDWYELLSHHLKASPAVRSWFAQNALFSSPHRFSQYLLECPATDVRTVFCKLLVFLAHAVLPDDTAAAENAAAAVAADGTAPGSPVHHSISEEILRRVLLLLKRDVPDHGRNVTQYFHFFLMYAHMGSPEKRQLLRLGVPAAFIKVTIEEGTAVSLKYQSNELGKLYSVVSQLLRCTDMSQYSKSAEPTRPPLSNPYGDDMLVNLDSETAGLLFARSSFTKKIIEDNTLADEHVKQDTQKLLRYVCWENPQFSKAVLGELLWQISTRTQIAYTYTHEMRPYMDLLLQMLLIEDSWQRHRILNTLKGVPDDRDGLFDTISRARTHYQKRAYQCIKMMVTLFQRSAVARAVLESMPEYSRSWQYAVDWLTEELERRPSYSTNQQYAYNNWSPPAQSNETSNGYFLQRSNSARKTLELALQYCPEPEDEEMDIEEEPALQPDETAAVITDQSTHVNQESSGYGSTGNPNTSNPQNTNTNSNTSGVVTSIPVTLTRPPGSAVQQQGDGSGDKKIGKDSGTPPSPTPVRSAATKPRASADTAANINKATTSVASNMNQPNSAVVEPARSGISSKRIPGDTSTPSPPMQQQQQQQQCETVSSNSGNQNARSVGTSVGQPHTGGLHKSPGSSNMTMIVPEHEEDEMVDARQWPGDADEECRDILRDGPGLGGSPIHRSADVSPVDLYGSGGEELESGKHSPH